MLPVQKEKAVFFGPQRALLRALLLKDADAIRAFARHFCLDVAEILSADVSVPEEAVLALWQLSEKLSETHPHLAVEASRLFQLTDLGERGWLLLTAPDLRTAASVFQEHFADINIKIIEGSESISFVWSPQKPIPGTIAIYSAAICLHQFICQGIPVAGHVDFVLPLSCRPQGKKVESALIERLWTDFGCRPTFADDVLTVNLKCDLLAMRFRAADESVFQFFLQRLEKSQNRGKKNATTRKPDDLPGKVKELLLRNISRPDYGCKEVAADLGISTRTLERSLARENFSLRAARQQLQQETAEEMLSIGIRAKEVATKIGFVDVTAFSRAFHNWTGISPTQYKKRTNDER
ncbi:AraC family transcriptional regulator [bacterium]|nr:AraC family transcriptional regulator [bacterium]